MVASSLAMLSVIAVTGCSDQPQESPAAEDYDVGRISQVEDAMPEGFVPFPTDVRKLQHQLVPQVGTVVSYGKPFTVEPAQCRPLLKPVDAQAGADSAGFRADGIEKRSIGVGADMPIIVPAAIPTTGCDRMTYRVEDETHPTSGTVERIAAPEIDGATTLALKITVDGFPDPDYAYTAIVDDRLYVDVQARLAPDYPAQPMLSDLLVQAVDAVRG